MVNCCARVLTVTLLVCPDDFLFFVGNVETYFAHTIHFRERVPPIVKLFYGCVPVVIEIGLIVWAFFVRFLFNATF